MLQRTLGLSICLSLVLGLLASPAVAQDKPDARTVMENYIKALGGREAHEKVKNVASEGSIEILGLGVKGSFKSWQTQNKQLVEMEINGIGKIVEATDGKHAWSLTAVQGNRVKEGKELDEALFDSALHGDLNWEKRYKKVEVAGVEEVEGKPAYKVICTPEKAAPRTMYFDKDSGLLLKVETKQTTPMGEFEAEMFVSDYKKVDGVMMPFKNRLKISGQELLITLDAVKVNADIPDGKFAIPAEIKELIK